jgi:DNA topoisomerase-1
MTWDVPTANDCPVCGQTMFKKSGKGRMKPFCINEKCENFLPEDKRGYYKKKDAEEAVEEKPAKKTAAKKTATKKTTTKKTTKTKETK